MLKELYTIINISLVFQYFSQRIKMTIVQELFAWAFLLMITSDILFS